MMPNPDIHMPLAQVCQDVKQRAAMLRRENSTLERLNHRRVFGAVLDGMIPAERINGRWYVRRDDLPKIAELLGVLPAPKIGRPRKVTQPAQVAA